jgi:cysteine synthase B
MKKNIFYQDKIFESIGNTPLIEFGVYKNAHIFIKCEYYNGFGQSIKSRTALSAIQHLEEKKINKDEQVLLTASSGNFAVSFAAIARSKGYHVAVVVNWNITKNNEDYLRFLGAEIIKSPDIVTTMQGNAYCKKLALENDSYVVFNQSENPICPETHTRTTGPEILQDMPDVKAIITSMGSGGTLLGISSFAKEHAPHVQMFHSVAENQDTTIVGHFREGLDTETPFIKKIIEKKLSQPFPSNNPTALSYCESLNQKGIMAGLQTGGALHAAHQAIDKHNIEGNVVVVCGDGIYKNLDKIDL